MEKGNQYDYIGENSCMGELRSTKWEVTFANNENT